MKNETKSLAELQAQKKRLEQDLTAAKLKTDPASVQKQETLAAQIEACDAHIELAVTEERMALQRGIDADRAITAMEMNGALHCQGAEAIARKKELKDKFVDPVHGAAAIAAYAGPSLEASAAGGTQRAVLVAGRVTPIAGALYGGDETISSFAVDCGKSYDYQFSSGWDAKRALGGYAALVCQNTRIPWNPEDPLAMKEKSALSLAAGNWFNRHLRGDNLQRWEHIPGKDLNRLVYGRELQAADYTDPNGQLGTLTGTLVLQRTLPVFAYQYPEFSAMLSDFSDAPGMYKQTEMTRIVIQAAVQLYNASLTGGRPIGWQTATEGQTTDVPFTLTDYISVPVAIGQNILGATTRKLFDEQAVLAIKAIAGYLATMVTNLFTGGPGGTFNYYSTVSGTVVPNAYPTYQVTSQEFSTKDLDKIGAAFTSAKVPPDERFILLNPTFYALLRNDLRLWFMYAASSRDTGNGASNFLTEAKLPKLSGFGIYEAGYMPSSVTNATLGVTTSNIVGVALHKAGVIVKSRLPQDFASSVTAMVPGSITTVSDPDTKTALMLVQYINLTQNFAEWRPEVMLGVAGGDIRGGLVIAGS